ncbi:ABC transporter permease subunit [Pseudonocardia acaciae]|uniref:ABC transporter permease subunit n=1 Tax=Pseudonocardia acaciae TaxID=551276 RepID=UPI000A05DFA1|nr:ABC transporter permease subunit [Pseudonocardia acaciae]
MGDLGDAVRRRVPAPVSLSVAAGLLVATVVGPVLAPRSVDVPVTAPYGSPSLAAPLGGDLLGRDVLSRLLAGGSSLLLTSALVAVVVTALAGVVGAAAVLRPTVGRFVEYGADLLILLPPLLGLLLFVLAWPDGGRAALVLASVLLALPYAVRVMASAAAPLASAGFVEAAVAGGERIGHLVWREVLPNLRAVLVTLLALRFVEAVYLVSTAGFLRVGVAPTEANWALMVRENGAGILLNPWAVVSPALAIGLLAIGVSLAADALAPGGRRAVEVGAR